MQLDDGQISLRAAHCWFYQDLLCGLIISGAVSGTLVRPAAILKRSFGLGKWTFMTEVNDFMIFDGR